MILSPSIASANPLEIGHALKGLEAWPYLHIDVEDGNFIPNITFGMKTVKAICKEAKGRQIQVHLMAFHPERYLGDLAAWGVDSVAAQVEALDYPLAFLNQCKALGMKGGLAVNMKTPIQETKIFWDAMDQMVIMTSEPDFAGEKLYQPALDRAICLAGSLPEKVELYADGGLDREALSALSRAGLHGAVLGRLVFQNPGHLKVLEELACMGKQGNRPDCEYRRKEIRWI